MNHTWARYFGQGGYCTPGTPKNFGAKFYQGNVPPTPTQPINGTPAQNLLRGGTVPQGNSDPSGGELWPENARAGERSLCTPPRAHV